MTPRHQTSLLVAVVVLAAMAGLGAQQSGAPPASGASLDVRQVRPNFYVIAGAGGNVGVQVGDDGAVVVDSGSAATADAIVAAIKRVTDQPIRYVINTGPDADHVGGNAVLAKAGQSILNLGGMGLALTNGGAATIVAYENVMTRMSAPTGETSPFPTEAWPTETFFERRRYMRLNGEAIEIMHQPSAHTDGDSLVFFRRSDVVMAGDTIDMRHFPVIDVARGGGIQGEIDALNRLVELAVPSIPLVWRNEGTAVIPGHGRQLAQLDVADYRDMITIVRDRVRALINEGKTLQQVVAAAPAQGYTRRYGSDSGPWTTNMFVEAVYTSLAKEKRP